MTTCDSDLVDTVVPLLSFPVDSPSEVVEAVKITLQLPLLWLFAIFLTCFLPILTTNCYEYRPPIKSKTMLKAVS